MTSGGDKCFEGKSKVMGQGKRAGGTSSDKMTLEVPVSEMTFEQTWQEEGEGEADIERTKRNVVEAKRTADAKALRQKPP